MAAQMQGFLMKFGALAMSGVCVRFLEPVARTLEKRYPETLEEQASKPKYLHERATEDPVSGLGLIELEQVRLPREPLPATGAPRRPRRTNGSGCCCVPMRTTPARPRG